MNSTFSLEPAPQAGEAHAAGAPSTQLSRLTIDETADGLALGDEAAAAQPKRDPPLKSQVDTNALDTTTATSSPGGPAAGCGSGASAAARNPSVVVRSDSDARIAAILDAATRHGLPAEGIAELEQSLLDLNKEWSAKYDKMGAIMLQSKQESDRNIRQLEADRLALWHLVNLEVSQREFNARQAAIAAASAPPAPVLAAMSAENAAEMARLKRENDTLVKENAMMHEQHASSFDVYKMQKELIGRQSAAIADLEERLRFLKNKYDRLKTHAETKLDEASSENERLRMDAKRTAQHHDQDTIAIRMRMKKAELEVVELNQELQMKKKQNAELKDI
ncbi:hypothetical protein PFISCL1PPCAC_23197, partial [Pristionchus fissidentatus]